MMMDSPLYHEFIKTCQKHYDIWLAMRPVLLGHVYSEADVERWLRIMFAYFSEYAKD